MQTPQHHPSKPHGRIAVCWHLLRVSYRYANRLTHHVFGAVLKLVVFVYFIFTVLFLTLRYAILPNIDHYKKNIEQLSSRVIGQPVSIARVYASWSGLRPNLFLGDVVIRDKDGRQALLLPSVAASLSWWSVPTLGLRFDNLEISRPDLDIRREADGKVYVAGIFLDPNRGGDGKGADWLLTQREIVVREGKIRWTDVLRGAPVLTLNNVNLVLHNRWRHHQAALQATPPPDFGAPIDVRTDFVHPPFASKISDVRRWKGVLFAALRDTDLAVWNAYVNYPFEVSKGKGSVQAWLTLDHAKLADFTADLTLLDVSARLRKDLQPLDLLRVRGRFSAREDYDVRIGDGKPTFGTRGHRIALTDFSLETRDGLQLMPTTIEEIFVPAVKETSEKTQIKVKLLDLRTLAALAGRLPLSPQQLRLLADFAPQGQLKDFSARWSGAYPHIASYNIMGEFIGLGMKAQSAQPSQPKTGKTPARAAIPAIPGFENLSGNVDANERGGRFGLASNGLKLQLPAYFSDPVMAFDRFNMQASWDFQEKSQFFFQIAQMDFALDGMTASLSGMHQKALKAQAGKNPGIIDVSAKLSGFDVKKMDRYLPLQTNPGLRDWLIGALGAGIASDVDLKLKGDLQYFPFRAEGGVNNKSKGEFRVSGKIDGGNLNYVPSHFAKDGTSPLWPVLEDVKGAFVFDRTRMEITADSARTAGIDLANVTAIIPDLLSKDAILDIKGSASGSLQDFVHYVSLSPVIDWIANFTEDTRASGNAKLALAFRLPFARLRETKVQGALQFSNNDVRLQSLLPLLTQTNGKLEFNEKGFALTDVAAQFVGGPLALSGGSQADGTIQIKVGGSVTSDGLRKAYPAAAMQRLADQINGSTRFSTIINVKNHQSEIVVESGLQGVALSFPAPLRKGPNETLPLRLQINSLPSNDAAFVRDEIKVSLGPAIAVRYLRQKSVRRNAQWRVLRGGIGVNEPPPEPDSGLHVNASMKVLNVDAWRNVAGFVAGTSQPAAEGAAKAEATTAVMAEAETEAETKAETKAATETETAAEAAATTVAATKPTPKPDPNSDAVNIAQYVDPDVLSARAAELFILGKKLENVVVGASHQKDVWQANIDSTQASGYVTWNQGGAGKGFGKVTARLALLIIPESAAADVTDLLEGKNEATQIPALDVVADNFELFNKKLGRFEVIADNIRTAAGREWHINKMVLSNPDAQFKASGNWLTKEGSGTTNMTVNLNINDAGRMLERFGFANVLRGGTGKMEGKLNWQGLPFSMDIPSLSGQISLNMAAGQFLKVEPGAAKLLGVLSLQALPRLLKLDFHDVFSEGFAFDGITASAMIANGVVTTDNLKMRGVNATVLMDGSADIAKESQDLHVVVIPEINVGTASVVYALAINPVIGLGSFLAQLFLRNPLMKALTFQYHITGEWKDPTVTKIESKFGQSVAPEPNATK
jgi:uncharacterized protein (TIGR02099 family)